MADGLSDDQPAGEFRVDGGRMLSRAEAEIISAVQVNITRQFLREIETKRDELKRKLQTSRQGLNQNADEIARDFFRRGADQLALKEAKRRYDALTGSAHDLTQIEQDMDALYEFAQSMKYRPDLKF